MSLVVLDAYSFNIRQRRGRALLPLPQFTKGADIVSSLIGYVNDIDGQHVDVSGYRRCISAANVVGDKFGVKAHAYVGEYGFGGRLVDASTGTLSYVRKVTDAPMEPYFFEFRLSTGSTKGIFLCERRGQSSAKGALQEYIKVKFRKDFPEFIMDIVPVMPQQAVKALLDKGKLSAVRLVQGVIPSDIADKFNGNSQQQEGEVEVVLRPKRSGVLSMDRISEIFNKTKNLSDLIEIEDFSPDRLKVEVEVDGRKKTVDFGNLSRVRGSFDISGEIQNGQDGFPTFSSVDTSAGQLMPSLLAGLP